MLQNYKFIGKVVLITGSSSGIGAATAILFSKLGAHVVVTGRNAYNVSQVAKQCLSMSSFETNALEIVADVSKEDDCEHLIERTIETFGKLDILVNNAGFALKSDIYVPKYIENYKNILDTNLNAIVYLTHISVKYLEKTKGNIINISSVGGLRASNDISSYCMAKCALDMFNNCMASELGPKGIRVNSINPGAIRTNIFVAMGVNKQISDRIWSGYGKAYPLGRCAEPEELAHAIVYLASDHASFITGTNFLFDGGAMAANVSKPDLD